MAITSPSAALVPVTLMLTTAERLALAGYLAGYSGLTREAYELDLRQYASAVDMPGESTALRAPAATRFPRVTARRGQPADIRREYASLLLAHQ